MPIAVAAKPKDIKDYYAALDAYAEQGVTHEGAVRSAFQNLLAETGRRAGWTLIPELPLGSIRPDGTFRNELLAVARTTVPPVHTRRLQGLLTAQRQRNLTESEQQEATKLVEQEDLLTLRKSKALLLLKQRGALTGNLSALGV